MRKSFFFTFFDMHHQKVQNSLQRMFFKKEKIFGSQRKISGKMFKVLADTLAKISQNIFENFSVSEHSASLLTVKGVCL